MDQENLYEPLLGDDYEGARPPNGPTSSRRHSSRRTTTTTTSSSTRNSSQTRTTVIENPQSTGPPPPPPPPPRLGGTEEDEDDDDDDDLIRPPSSPVRPDHFLRFHERLGYSVGHVFNDLCASMWFSYLLVYFHLVLKFDSTVAGLLLTFGQVADGLATPFVGIQSDKPHPGWPLCFSYGKRKTWHLIGSICVLGSFPFLFNRCIDCDPNVTSQLAQSIYYAAFIAIFQFGWASVQISHLSLIPEVTPYSQERVELNALRYAFTVVSNIAVYLITWVILGLNTVSDSDQNENQISAADEIHFRYVTLLVVAIGALFTFIFHVSLNERRLSAASATAVSRDRDICGGGGGGRRGPRRSRRIVKRKEQTPPMTVCPDEAAADSSEGSSSDLFDSGSISSVEGMRAYSTYLDYSLPDNHLKWYDWFCHSEFYSVALLYTGTRLCINLSQIYTPLYLQKTLKSSRESIAYIPLVVYCSGFAASFWMKYLNKLIGKRRTCGLGCLIAIGAYSWLYLGGTGDSFKNYQIYGVAILMGVSSTAMLITSLGITNDLIGHNISSGAFVFGAMSFFDKVSNGAAVMVIQALHPCESPLTTCVHDYYYQIVISGACGGAALICFTGLLFISKSSMSLYKRHDDGDGSSGRPSPDGTHNTRTMSANREFTDDGPAGPIVEVDVEETRSLLPPDTDGSLRMSSSLLRHVPSGTTNTLAGELIDLDQEEDDEAPQPAQTTNDHQDRSRGESSSSTTTTSEPQHILPSTSAELSPVNSSSLLRPDSSIYLSPTLGSLTSDTYFSCVDDLSSSGGSSSSPPSGTLHGDQLSVNSNSSRNLNTPVLSATPPT